MDTKSRKFDRSMISKIIAFLLALIFVFAGAMRVMDMLRTVSERNADLDSYYANVFSQGKDFELETSKMFQNEYNHFMRYAVMKAAIYGDGTKADYNELKNRLEKKIGKAYENYKAEIIQDVTRWCDDENYHTVLDELERGLISLTRLDSHGGDHKIGATYVYAEDDYYYEDDEIDEDYDDDEYYTTDGYYTSDRYYTTDEYNTTMESSVDLTAPSAMTSTTHKTEFSTINGVSTEIAEKAKDADTIVIICNTDYYGEYLDGYYAVKINADVAYNELIERYEDGYEGVDYSYYFDISYNGFKDSAKRINDNLNLYENLKFALVNNQTGKVVSNDDSIKSNASERELRKIFLAYPWSFVKTSADGFTDMGSRFQNIVESGQNAIDLYNTGFGQYMDESDLGYYLDSYTLYVRFDETISGDDMFNEMDLMYADIYRSAVSGLRYLGFMLLGFIICVVILVIKSGRKHDDDELHMMYTDKIFILLRTAITGGLIFGLVYLAFGVYESWYRNQLAFTYTSKLCAFCAVLIAAFLIDWILYIARHIKNGTLFKNMLIVLIVKWVFVKPIVALHRKAKQCRQKCKERPAVYKDIFNDVLRKFVLWVLVPNTVVGLILLLAMTSDAIGLSVFILILLAIYDVFTIAYAIKYAYSLRKVFYALNQVKMGNYEVTINTASMPQTVKAYANDVTAINQGLSYAVDNAVKEQRMKTELITNVSHDLKTPLTSIITYVDLLSRCNIDDANAKEYIGVLGEKSARLKRLIEDLVEASKASSGAVNVELIKVSLNELTRQVTGEYADEFESRGLTLVEQEDEESIIIMADSKLCYRVFDNLMSNVKKYAMPGTRVYLRIYKHNGKGVISLRNVSEKQLNIPAAELMARFVRGDESRSSDGNGLGLSIAENFCTLQGGKLSLEISGDLFTATVEYNLSE